MSDEREEEVLVETYRTEDVNKIEDKKTYASIIKADPLYSDVSKIVHWREPIRTGLIFGIFNFFYFLYEFYEYTILTLVAYLALAVTLVSLSYANFVVLKAKWVQGKQVENPFKERFRNIKFHVPRQTVEQHLNTIVDLINHTIDQLRDVFYATDNLLTLQWALYFYVAATIGGWFGGATLIYFGSFVLFVWPRLYEEKQKEIDHFYGIAKVEADKYIQLGLSKLPPAVTERFPALAARDKKTN